MDSQEKINELRGKIYSTLTPLVTGDYVLLDVSYHNNIGDTLIWEGEMEFLKSIKYKCLEVASYAWWRDSLPPATVILLQGGGNFGDLYRGFQNFKLRVISQFPNNKIIIFPQSVWYEDESLIAKDAEIMAMHKDLTICARDQWSYDFLKKHFGRNKILLVPDMAFCISDKLLNEYRGISDPGRKLYFRRIDKEFEKNGGIDFIDGMEVHDWPTIENLPIKFRILFKLQRLFFLSKGEVMKNFWIWSLKTFVKSISLRDNLVKQGCTFIAKYEDITTTRLHGLILSVLLHKHIEYIDNTTGKLSSFVDTWLNDLENLKKSER